jgi:hypothetical protein
MRYRITVRGDGVELRGFMDAEPKDFYAFAEAMEPYGLVVGSPADDDYNPFVEPGATGWGRRAASEEGEL